MKEPTNETSSQNEPTLKTTHFGFQQVPVTEKAEKVAAVFDSVAASYDRMNDLMSFGIHRWWKWVTSYVSHVREGNNVLDIAGGTGDLTRYFAKRVGETGHVVLADINSSMLKVGRARLVDQGVLQNVSFLQANAEYLPFLDNSFHIITLAFGLRNMTDKAAALASLYRVLKPGGQVLILEFSKPVLPGLQTLYDHYSFSLLPKMGQWVAGDGESYQYLAESIRMHPDQNTLLDMLKTAGFEGCSYHNFTGGIVALHRGYKY